MNKTTAPVLLGLSIPAFFFGMLAGSQLVAQRSEDQLRLQYLLAKDARITEAYLLLDILLVQGGEQVARNVLIELLSREIPELEAEKYPADFPATRMSTIENAKEVLAKAVSGSSVR